MPTTELWKRIEAVRATVEVNNSAQMIGNFVVSALEEIANILEALEKAKQ